MVEAQHPTAARTKKIAGTSAAPKPNATLALTSSHSSRVRGRAARNVEPIPSA